MQHRSSKVAKFMASLTKERRVLLVDGYIRKLEKILDLSNIIPFSINSIIFEFQLLVERWNKEWSNSKVNIMDDGDIAEINVSREVTVYGDYIVKYGENFMWNVEIIKGEKTIDCSFWLGLTPNKEKLLKQYEHSFDWYYQGGYVWEASSGFFGYDNGKAARYSDKSSIYKFKNEGDKVQIRFNWKDSSLHYIVNGKDFGNALETGQCGLVTTDKDAEFRLAVCILRNRASDTIIKLKIDGESF